MREILSEETYSLISNGCIIILIDFIYIHLMTSELLAIAYGLACTLPVHPQQASAAHALAYRLCIINFKPLSPYDCFQEQIAEFDGTTGQKEEKPYPGDRLDKGVARQAYVATGPTEAEHDYDEPYFEPASEFDTLLEQLKELMVTNIQESSLRSVEALYSVTADPPKLMP